MREFLVKVPVDVIDTYDSPISPNDEISFLEQRRKRDARERRDELGSRETRSDARSNDAVRIRDKYIDINAAWRDSRETRGRVFRIEGSTALKKIARINCLAM